MKRYFFSVFVCTLILNTQQAQAVWWASEPTQVANNLELILSYAKQYEHEAYTELMYYKQILQYAEQIKQGNFANLGYQNTYLNDLTNVVSDIADTINGFEGLQTAVTDLQTLQKKEFSTFGASGLTWQQYLTRVSETNRLKTGSATYMSVQDQAAITRAQQAITVARQYAAQIPNSSSMHQTLDDLSSQMNMLVTIMAESMQLQAQQNQHYLEKEQLDTQVKTANTEDTTNTITGKQAAQSLERRRARAMVPYVK